MPRNGYDYHTAKMLKLKGLSYSQIAQQTGIPYETLKRFGHRQDWDKDRDRVSEIVARTVPAQLAAQSDKHLLSMSNIATDAIAQCAEHLRAKPTLGALEKLAHVAETFDRVARRTYGLDKQEERTSVHIGLLMHDGPAPAWQTQANQVVDVDATIVPTEQPAPDASSSSNAS